MPETKVTFDAESALAKVKAHRKTAKRRTTWGKSKLVQHRAEMVKLRQAGASFADIQHWLRKECQIKTAESTVRRYMQKLSELAAAQEAEDAKL